MIHVEEKLEGKAMVRRPDDAEVLRSTDLSVDVARASDVWRDIPTQLRITSKLADLVSKLVEPTNKNHNDNIGPDITWVLGISKEFQTHGSFNQPSSSNPR